MTINFNKIEIHHFMSFDDEIFDFSNSNGMTLVTGKNLDIATCANGAGKSSLFNALLYGLFGQLPNKISASYIANRNFQDKEVRIVIYLEINDVFYKVVSGLNKRAQSYFNVIQLQDEKEIDLTKSTITETRKFFENEILRCDMSLFLRTIMLTPEHNYNFFNLKKQEKKDFIEKLFDIGIFGEMYDDIHKDILQFDKKILSHQNQLLVLSNNEKNYQDSIDRFKIQQEDQKTRLNEEIDAKKHKLEEFSMNKVVKNTELIEKCNQAILKLQNSLFESQQKSMKNKTDLNLLLSDISQKKKQIDDRQSILDKHNELLGKLCADCKSIFSEYHSLDRYQSEIRTFKENIELDQIKIKKLNEECKIIEQKTQKIKDKDQQIKSKIKELTEQYDSVVKVKNQLQNELSMLQFKRDQIDESKNPYISLLEKNNIQLEEENKQLSLISQKYKYLKKAEEIVSHESLKQFIIKDLIGVINSRIRYYLSKIGSKYTCIFDENLDYYFITESGECELPNFSGGEKKRLDIATCLSFRDFIAQRSNIKSNILILDEYIDSALDTLAVDSILNILKDFTKQDKLNVFVISHRHEASEQVFNHIIEVQKKNGISTIQYLS